MAATSATESRCPACSTPGALPGERCSGCRDLVETDACSIDSWRGHQSAAFVARRDDGTIVGTSPTFQWSDEGNDGPRAAFEQLLLELEEAGWEASAHSPDEVWYERWFTRLLALPGESLPPPLPALSPAVEPPRRGRGPRLVTALSVAGLVVAGGLLYALLTRDTGHTAKQKPVAAAVALVTAKPQRQQAAAPPVDVAKPPTRVAVLATKDSWLELRRGTAAGPVLFSGVLSAGHDLRVRARSVWASFGAAANLQVSVNGRRVPLQGTLERTFSR